jgi:hypothetical protein
MLHTAKCIQDAMNYFLHVILIYQLICRTDIQRRDSWSIGQYAVILHLLDSGFIQHFGIITAYHPLAQSVLI